MANTRHRGRARSQRKLDWAEGVAAFDATLVDMVENTTILLNLPNKERQTVMRIVGSVSMVPKVEVFGGLADVVGEYDGVIECGIQVVNRAAGVVGSARNPATGDDRQGREWMWRRTYRRAYVVTHGAAPGNLADWFIPLHETGSDDTRVDIKVKRVLDRSQDELVFSMTHVSRRATGSLASMEFFAHIDLRCLMLV